MALIRAARLYQAGLWLAGGQPDLALARLVASQPALGTLLTQKGGSRRVS